MIKDNKIHDCGRLPRTNREHGIYLGKSRRATIRGNWLWNNADRGVQLYPDAQRTARHAKRDRFQWPGCDLRWRRQQRFFEESRSRQRDLQLGRSLQHRVLLGGSDREAQSGQGQLRVDFNRRSVHRLAQELRRPENGRASRSPAQPLPRLSSSTAGVETSARPGLAMCESRGLDGRRSLARRIGSGRLEQSAPGGALRGGPGLADRSHVA